MCGIFGYYDRRGDSLAIESVRKMGRVIAHRGPDDEGVFVTDGCAIGNQRLSIIDVEGGHQPFVSADGQIAVVQNGEIYNHIELAEELSRDGVVFQTRSDTEVLLRLYERHGIDFLHLLNGMFCFAILDKRQNALYLVRDRIGVKPLYIHDDGQRILFSSEIKSLLQAGVQCKINVEALDLFLAYNFVPPPHTMFKGVKHLLPGHLLRVNKQSAATRCWWDLAALAGEQHRSESEWMDEFNTLLDDAVRLRMRADVPFGAFLSGGVDSSTVVGLMRQHSNHPVKTFSIGFHEKKYDEASYAQEAAERFSCEHVMERVESQMLNLWPMATYYCDQPHGDVSFLPTYRVAELASKHVKMVLTGDGGDELFAGYDKYLSFFTRPESWSSDNSTFRDEYCQQISLFTDEQRSGLLHERMASALLGHDPWALTSEVFQKTGHLDRINQALMIDMLLLLPGNNLVKPDRMGMALSLEARTPFLDYRMMEFAFHMPGSMKLRNGETKYIFKKAVEPLIGKNLAYRKKQMFTVPVGDWFRTSLYPMVVDLLLSARALDRQYFNPVHVRNIAEQHRDGHANYTRHIRALMAVEIWSRLFLDGEFKNVPSVMSTL